MALWAARLSIDYDSLVDRLITMGGEGCFCQASRLDLIATWRHAVSAALRALNSISSGRNIASKAQIEYLIRLFGRRQISEVLRLARPEDDPRVLIVCFGRDIDRCVKLVDGIEGVVFLDDALLKSLDEERASRILSFYGLRSDTPINEVFGRVLTRVLQLDVTQ